MTSGETRADMGPRLELSPGLFYYPGYLDRERQLALLFEIRQVIEDAPLFRPTMPRSGTPFSVLMSNCGPMGWVSDRTGYRYAPAHPASGRPWPAIPGSVLAAWDHLAGYPHRPEACLVNYYAPTARMGLHQDRDEKTFAAPVLSLSLGDTCLFRFGGHDRRGPTQSIKLASGDALVLGGEARLAFHGVDRIYGGSSSILEEGGRFNLTVRRVGGDMDIEQLL